MKPLRGFTLVEMIIVIVIISIMLSITLNMSANQTKSLRFKIARESFLANYNSFIIRAITTNSNDLSLQFKIDNGAQIFAPITTVGGASISFEDMSSLKLTDIDDITTAGTLQTISFSPSLGQCLIDGNPTGNNGSDTIIVGIGDRRSITVSAECYTISLSTCKIKQGC